MGKVYDALRRAEEERGRQATGAGAPTVPTAPPEAGAAGRPGRRKARRGAVAAPVPDRALDANRRRIALLDPESFVTEQFRTLRARIEALAAQRPIRTIQVTSALAGEGKSTAALNLALVTAMELDRKVLLVECDLRRPEIHVSLGITPRAGLAEVLLGEAPLEEAIHPVEGTRLHVLPVRKLPPNPSELLSSERMRKLVEELSHAYDTVFFDTPATLGLPDAKELSELMDGVVMVVRADATPREDLESALDILDRRRILGLVFNGAEVDVERYEYRD